MVKNAIRKNNIREIFRSPGRYFAILGIILLGAGFFSGLRVTRDAMVKTADTYLENAAFYDFQLVSTLGYTESEVEAVRASGLVQAAEGAFQQDLLVSLTEEDTPVRFLNLPKSVNLPEVTSGRLPEKPDEVLLDANTAGQLQIGDELVISTQNSEEALKSLAAESFTVVGFCSSPLYLNYERGSTTIGSGSISFFAYLLPEAFTGDTYSAVYVRLGDLGFLYSEEYDAAADAAEPKITELAKAQAHIRYENLIADNTDKLNDGEAEYEDGLAEYESAKADAEKQLEEAGAELEKSRTDLDNGWEELSKGKEELATGREEAEKELAAAQAELDAALESSSRFPTTSVNAVNATRSVAGGGSVGAVSRCTSSTGSGHARSPIVGATPQFATPRPSAVSAHTVVIFQDLGK